MIGDKLKLRRVQLDLTQAQLAEMTGIKKNTISNYENNISSPSEGNLIRLMRVLNCDANFLYEDYIFDTNFVLLDSDKQRIKKYKKLDQYGKEAVDSVLDIEYKRCTESEMISIDTAARGDGDPQTEQITKEKAQQIPDAEPDNDMY